jgi:hypothetical protein
MYGGVLVVAVRPVFDVEIRRCTRLDRAGGAPETVAVTVGVERLQTLRATARDREREPRSSDPG